MEDVVTTRMIKRKYLPYLLCIPAIAYVVAIVIYPTIFSLLMAFRVFRLGRGLAIWNMPFVGAMNFATLLHDRIFLISLGNTVIIVGTAVVIEFMVGLGLALLLNRMRGAFIFASLILTPMMFPMIAAGLTWRMLVHLRFGIINAFMKLVVRGGINWLGSPRWSLSLIGMVEIWQWTPFVMLVLLAGLRAIPEELFESSSVDGANSLQMFWHMALPQLKWPIMVVLLIRAMECVKIFDTVYILTGGGPGNSSSTLSFYNYLVAFREFRLGYGAAMSWIIFILIFGVITLVMRFFLKKEEV